MRGLAPPRVLFVILNLLFWCRCRRGSRRAGSGIIVVRPWGLGSPLRLGTWPRRELDNLAVRLLRILRRGFWRRFFRGLLHGTTSSALDEGRSGSWPGRPRQDRGRKRLRVRTRLSRRQPGPLVGRANGLGLRPAGHKF